MKRRFVTLVVFAMYGVSIIAQSVYMHEAQDDARHSDGDGISSILGILTLIGMGLFIIIFVPLMIGDKISDAKFSKKYDRRSNLLKSEALSILNVLAIRNKDFAQIKESEKWKDWFLKGYRDGVDNGETECVKNENIKPLMYEKIPWEEYSVRKFTHLSSSDIYIKFECGGDARLSKLAYDEGRRNGVERRNKRGDLREMLN